MSGSVRLPCVVARSRGATIPRSACQSPCVFQDRRTVVSGAHLDAGSDRAFARGEVNDRFATLNPFYTLLAIYRGDGVITVMHMMIVMMLLLMSVTVLMPMLMMVPMPLRAIIGLERRRHLDALEPVLRHQ
jgi:hypothetical protein